MAQVITKKLAGQIPGHHRKLVKKLRHQGYLPNTVFLTTNYDILIDNAFLSPPQQGAAPGSVIDYGVEFTNFDAPPGVDPEWSWSRASPTANKLFKLHGSLNWLYCSTCNSLTLTPRIKGAVLSMDDPRLVCHACGSRRTPIIVPPTFYKDMSRVFLSTVWNKAESALRKVDHLILCGYSFPDADMHIKYLLKRIQTNRDGQKLRVTVISNHPNKTETQRNEEKLRYRRFLGRGVDYTDSSFEEFAREPSRFY